MRTKEINRLVDPAYSALHVLNAHTWTAYRDKCRALACEEERQHRRGKPADVRIPKGASIDAAARMFVVKRIAGYLLGEHVPTIGHILHYQPSAIYAAAIVANYREECAEALKDCNLRALADLDYVQFINDGETP